MSSQEFSAALDLSAAPAQLHSSHVARMSSVVGNQAVQRMVTGVINRQATAAPQTRQQTQELKPGTVSEVSWGETSGLYPSKENKFKPSAWDSAKVNELLRLRAAIHAVGGRGEKVHRAKPNTKDKIEKMLIPYHSIENFPDVDREIADKAVRWFYLSKKASLPVHPTMPTLVAVKTYGPFYSIGGGDAGEGEMYVHFYKKKA